MCTWCSSAPRIPSGQPPEDNVAYITFYSPRAGIPAKLAANHFRFPLVKLSLYHRLVALLRVVEYELGDRQITVHLGWPMSSWLDRMAIGVMIFNMMRLPRLFPNFRFIMSYTEPTGSASKIQRRRSEIELSVSVPVAGKTENWCAAQAEACG